MNALEQWMRGKSIAEASAALGISVETLRKWRLKVACPPPRQAREVARRTKGAIPVECWAEVAADMAKVKYSTGR